MNRRDPHSPRFNRGLLWIILIGLCLILLLVFLKVAEFSSNENHQSGRDLDQAATAPQSREYEDSSNSQHEQSGPGISIPFLRKPGSLTDVEMTFYGKLEDQFGNPVPSAKVTGSVTDLQLRPKQTYTTTDENGFFTLRSSGLQMGVTAAKAGYVMAETNTLFKYLQANPDYHVPDPSKPVILKMWKVQEPTSKLVLVDKIFEFPAGSDSVRVDLISRRLTNSGGDLIVTVKKSVPRIDFANRANWAAEIEVIDGGILEVDEDVYPVTFFAPEKGYSASYTEQMDVKNPYWSYKVRRNFFLKLRGGTAYGKFYIVVSVDYGYNNETALKIEGVLNPNGRSWEGKAIRPDEPTRPPKVSE